MNEWLALAIALALAVGVGLVNGLVTTLFRIPSFITTLGMFFVLQGLNNLLISGHQLIMFDPSLAMDAASGRRSEARPFYMPLIWMFVIAAIVFWFVLTRTRYGNWTFATGGKVGPAKAMGVPTARVKRINFMLASFLAGLAGCMQFAYLRGVTQAQGQNYELLAITAAVLGGTSLFGGTGHDLGQRHRRLPARVDPDRARPDRRAGLVLRDLHRRSCWSSSSSATCGSAVSGRARRERGGHAADARRQDGHGHRRAAPPPAGGAGARDDARGRPQRRAGLRAARVSHSYGRNRVIFDVDLSVWPGEVVGLVGDNGAGKSTLLKIFAGYQRPTSGTLRFAGPGRPLRVARRRARDSGSRPSTRTSRSSTS